MPYILRYLVTMARLFVPIAAIPAILVHWYLAGPLIFQEVVSQSFQGLFIALCDLVCVFFDCILIYEIITKMIRVKISTLN